MAGMRIFGDWRRGCRSCQVFGIIEDTRGGDCFELATLKEIDWLTMMIYTNMDCFFYIIYRK